LLHRLGGRIVLVIVTFINFCTWGTLFFYGLPRNIMTLRLDIDLLLQEGAVPQDVAKLLRQMVDLESIAEMVKTDVSLLRAASDFPRWFLADGHLPLLLAVMMLGVLCIVFTTLDMGLLLLAACSAGSSGKRSAAASEGTGLGSEIMEVVKILKHLAMLDVFVVGVMMVPYVTEEYRDQGMYLNTADGIYLLLGSELTHYLTYYIVDWGVRVLEPKGANAKTTNL